MGLIGGSVSEGLKNIKANRESLKKNRDKFSKRKNDLSGDNSTIFIDKKFDKNEVEKLKLEIRLKAKSERKKKIIIMTIFSVLVFCISIFFWFK